MDNYGWDNEKNWQDESRNGWGENPDAFQVNGNNAVFSNEGELLSDRTVSGRMYNVLVGVHLLYGILLTVGLCALLGRYMFYVYAGHPFLFTLAFFVTSFAGGHIASRQNYALSLLGYTICVAGFGALLSTIVPLYAMPLVLTAGAMTFLVLLTMTAAAIFMPNAFLSIGRTVFTSLIGLLVAEVAAMIFGFYNYGLFGVIGLFLFSLYIGFDWARGQRYPKTASFAVITALSLYMDVINIFIRILSLMNKKR